MGAPGLREVSVGGGDVWVVLGLSDGPGSFVWDVTNTLYNIST